MFSIDADGKSNYLTCYDFEKNGTDYMCVLVDREDGNVSIQSFLMRRDDFEREKKDDYCDNYFRNSNMLQWNLYFSVKIFLF